MSDRDEKGRFGKGNTVSKMDFTKEMARHVSSQEMYWAAKQMCRPYKELKAEVASGKFEDESLFVYSAIKKTVKGDFKAAQWLMEMINGKAKQQVEMANESGKSFELSYKLGDK